MPPEQGRVHRAAVPQNGNHLSQDLIVPEGPILIGKGIAPRDEAIAAFFNHPVDYEPRGAMAQRNLPWKKLRHAPPANGHDIAWPHGGEHAGSVDFQASLSELANHFSN
jgi:hypothetical protein